jgi:hypothetical protein
MADKLYLASDYDLVEIGKIRQHAKQKLEFATPKFKIVEQQQTKTTDEQEKKATLRRAAAVQEAFSPACSGRVTSGEAQKEKVAGSQ